MGSGSGHFEVIPLVELMVRSPHIAATFSPYRCWISGTLALKQKKIHRSPALEPKTRPIEGWLIGKPPAPDAISGMDDRHRSGSMWSRFEA